MFKPELETGEITCPRCGEPAVWESNGTDIEVDCSECGRFPITAEQLEEALDAYDEDKDH